MVNARGSGKGREKPMSCDVSGTDWHFFKNPVILLNLYRTLQEKYPILQLNYKSKIKKKLSVKLFVTS